MNPGATEIRWCSLTRPENTSAVYTNGSLVPVDCLNVVMIIQIDNYGSTVEITETVVLF